MTPERAGELAEQIAQKANECCYRTDGYKEDMAKAMQQAILQACAEERADMLKNEFICARCQLRQDSTRETKHDF